MRSVPEYSRKIVDERAPKPPAPQERDEPSLRRPPPSRAPNPAEHVPSLTPSASAALAAASAALAAFEAPAAPPKTDTITDASAPRALIDLFPAAGASTTTDVPMPRPVVAALAEPEAAVYGRFYGLAESPFDLPADPRFLFHWDSHDRVLRAVATAIGRHDGTILLTGEAGAGKTTLARALVAQLGRRTLVSFVTEPVAAARDLLQTVLVDFGVISRADAASGRLGGASRDDLASTLRDFLASLSALQAVALIVIDDAHRLPAAILGDLQVLAEIGSEHTLLQVVLVGEPDLAARLSSDELQAWNRLIGLRAELGPLSAGDVADYVAHRLAVAGTTDALFDASALARLHEVSRGTPRNVNLIADRALIMGQRASARSIDEDTVDRAARDLGVLPEAAAASGNILLVALLAALMLAGAAGAGWVLREPLVRVLARYGVSLSR
jgi:general secretion pathway protein A